MEVKHQVKRVMEVLSGAGLKIIHAATPRHGRPHAFMPYPSIKVEGCVRCPYPREHPVHHTQAVA